MRATAAGFCSGVLARAAVPSISSITARHPGLTFALFRRMQEVIREMLGISELHRRMASLMHICCARALKAKLDDDVTIDSASARPAVRLTLRMVMLVAVTGYAPCPHHTTPDGNLTVFNRAHSTLMQGQLCAHRKDHIEQQRRPLRGPDHTA